MENSIGLVGERDLKVNFNPKRFKRYTDTKHFVSFLGIKKGNVLDFIFIIII